MAEATAAETLVPTPTEAVSVTTAPATIPWSCTSADYNETLSRKVATTKPCFTVTHTRSISRHTRGLVKTIRGQPTYGTWTETVRPWTTAQRDPSASTTAAPTLPGSCLRTIYDTRLSRKVLSAMRCFTLTATSWHRTNSYCNLGLLEC